jgi:mRNA interferase MazF
MRLVAADFSSGGLLVESFARPGKLFTANEGLMVRSVGRLHDATLHGIREAVITILRAPRNP